MPFTTFAVQVPLEVLDAKMSASSKIGFQQLLAQCGRKNVTSLQGAYREIAKLLHIPKTSFMRSVPKWAEQGWVKVEEVGDKVILTLINTQFAVPNRDTVALDQNTHPVLPVPTWDTFGPNRDTIAQKSDVSGPTWDKNGPEWDDSPPNACVESVILPITTDLLLISNNTINNNLPPIIYDQDQSVPELTTELALELVGHLLPVPKRPKGGADIEHWYRDWYAPTEKILAKMQLQSPPDAWGLIDLVTRYMSWAGSWWGQNRGSFTMNSVEKTWDVQLYKMGKDHPDWQPDGITPYPGCPTMGHEEEQQEDPLLPAIPQWDIRDPQPFANLHDLKKFAHEVGSSNGGVLDFVTDEVAGEGFFLYALTGPESYLGIDSEIWNNPTDEELKSIYKAVAYGCAQKKRQVVTV